MEQKNQILGLLAFLIVVVLFVAYVVGFETDIKHLKKQIADLESELQIYKDLEQVHKNNYTSCQSELSECLKVYECKERKPLPERLKKLTLQDVIDDIVEMQGMVEQFNKGR